VSVTPPEGFAELTGRGDYEAVSPEGMLFRIKSIKNDPQKDLEFWGDALQNHLAKEGYRLKGAAESFDSGDRDGLAYEWVLPYGRESYLYLTALIVTDKTITLAEAAAPYSVYIEYQGVIRESLATIRPRR
jgi:hypothetical protein